MAKQVEAQIHEETKLWSFITLCQRKTRMQGRKSQKKSTIQQFRKLWNPTCEIFATCKIEEERNCCRTESWLVAGQFCNLRNHNFNLQNFCKLRLNLRNPLVIWDIWAPTPFDIYLQIFVCNSLFSPCNPPMTSFLGWEVSRRSE